MRERGERGNKYKRERERERKRVCEWVRNSFYFFLSPDRCGRSSSPIISTSEASEFCQFNSELYNLKERFTFSLSRESQQANCTSPMDTHRANKSAMINECRESIWTWTQRHTSSTLMEWKRKEREREKSEMMMQSLASIIDDSMCIYLSMEYSTHHLCLSLLFSHSHFFSHRPLQP